MRNRVSVARRPNPTFAQKTVEMKRWVMSFRCRTAAPVPKSLKIATKATNTAAMPSKPKSDGLTKRASTARVANCSNCVPS